MPKHAGDRMLEKEKNKECRHMRVEKWEKKKWMVRLGLFGDRMRVIVSTFFHHLSISLFMLVFVLVFYSTSF